MAGNIKQMISKKSIDGIIFDLGGVLVEIDFDSVFLIWSSYAGLEQESIKSRFIFDEYYKQHERGEISYQEYFETLRNSLNIRITDDQFIEGWNAIFGNEIKNITAILSKLSQRLPLFLLTNTNSLHQRIFKKKYAKLLSFFKQIFISSDIGLRKPEPEIFKHISRTTKIDLKRFVFFDDTLENIIGGTNVGIRSIQVKSIADITKNLGEILK